MEPIEIFNRMFFLKINASQGTAAWAVDLATIIADDLIYLIPALLVVLWLWGNDAQRRLALKACLVALLGVGFNQVIGLFYRHPRPFMIDLGHTWLTHTADSSFPSDHVTVFVGIGMSLLFGRMALPGAVTLAVGLCVAWARVFLGVHFPLDMLGAVGVACFSSAVVSPIWRHTGNQVTECMEKLYRNIMARPIAWGLVRR